MIVGVALLAAAVVFWSRIWPFVLAAVGLVGVEALVWCGWRTLREIRRKYAIFSAEQRVLDNNRRLEQVGKLSGEEFEKMVVGLSATARTPPMPWLCHLRRACQELLTYDAPHRA